MGKLLTTDIVASSVQPGTGKKKSNYFFGQLLRSTLLILLPALLLLGYQQYNSLRSALHELQRAGRTQANEAARTADRTLDRINQLVDFLLTRDEVRFGDAQHCNTLLAGFQTADLLLLRNIVVLDNAGRPFCATHHHSALKPTMAGMPWYEAAVRKNGRFLSDPLEEAIDGRPGVAITDIVRGGNGESAGMVVALLDMDRIASTVLKAYDLPAGSIMSIIDRDFRLMARNPDGQKFFGTKVRVQPQGRRYLPDPVVVHLGVDNVYRVRTVVQLENAPWQLFVGIPVQGLVSAVTNAAWSGLAVLTALGLTCFTVAWFNARRLSAPAQTLALAAKRFGEGQRSTRVDSGMPGEFGHMAHEFNEMAEAIERLEHDRIESARIRAESQAKTQFLARMSHELRTPLNAMLGFSRLLHEGTKDSLDTVHSRYLTLVRDAGQQLSGLIDDVLDMARIEAGQLTVKHQVVEPGRLVATALRMCEAQASAAGVTLVNELDALKLPRLRTDPLRFQQVLLNLLSNAIKYNREGGEVRVALECNDGNATLVVSDTGMGMSPQQLVKAFEPFNRLGRETSAIPGTGIGLTLTRQLVDLLAGDLELESTEGVGTTARVTLRGAVAEDAAVVGETATAAQETGEPEQPVCGTVLYIEDISMNVALVQALLAPMTGVKLLVAETAALGLALAQEHNPQVVLLDMHLPDMSGLEVLTQLRSRPASKDTPIIALSASAMADEVARARTCGATDYWPKPIQFEQFRQGIRQLLWEANAGASAKAPS